MQHQAATMILLLVLAGLLAALGRWGLSNGAALVPAHLHEEERDRRATVVRRGGAACYVGAVAMAAVAILAVL